LRFEAELRLFRLLNRHEIAVVITNSIR